MDAPSIETNPDGLAQAFHEEFWAIMAATVTDPNEFFKGPFSAKASLYLAANTHSEALYV